MNPSGFPGHQHLSENKRGAKEDNKMNDKMCCTPHSTLTKDSELKLESYLTSLALIFTSL